MCGSNSAITSVRAFQDGGAVAIIHHAFSSQQLRLYFHNPTSPITAPTHVSCPAEYPEWCGQVMKGLVQLQIHQHGDLTAAHSSVAASSSLLHTIHLKDTPDGQTASELRERLELGAGGAGVIGRMLSVVDGEREIGNGVIGWN